MDKAKIQSILQARFNQNNWKQFLSEVFSGAQLLTSPEVLIGINTDVAVQTLRLGSVKLNEDGIERHIAVFEVTLATGIVLERNRVGLRNLLRKYWRDIDGAFIVYHRPESSSWRFTYVSELTGFNLDGEIIKVKTEPKRYTYVLGERESCKTAAERFSMLANKGAKATLDDVKEAFSVEKLSKSFFEEYKEHYQNFVQFFTGKRLVKNEEKLLSKPNAQLAYIFNGDEKDVRDFCKKLLGRIVFLYFIQKKGWLGVPKGSEWGQGDYHFLTNLFKHCRNPQLFYQQYLSKLFFDTLNNQREGDLIELIEGQFCRIPYLNGGLFEEDDPKHRELIFEANMFKDLFEFFNQYNFTIYEDDPNDHTVAVDPEMLGHIFENLLEDNKDKGAFYTPKEIVHYMCQESLIEYLTTWFEDKGYEVYQESFVSFDNPTQTSFISANDGRTGQGILEIAQTSTKPNKRIDRTIIEKLLKKQLNDEDKKAVVKNAKEFNDALDAVKICDPAIGSGAFPMGLLHEIYTAKQTLHIFQHGNAAGFDAATTKLNIIQNSIYGVDIERGAVDIARLRFWLSLVVDEEKPKALPNLDFKIVVGNSLISKLGDDVIEIDWDIKPNNHGLFGAEEAKSIKVILEEITKLQKDFFNPNARKKDHATKICNLKIDLLIEQLNLMINSKGLATKPSAHGRDIVAQTNLYLQTQGWLAQVNKLQSLKAQPEKQLDFFDWQLNFAEVMNKEVSGRAGFDIVIGNPPWVSMKGKHGIEESKRNNLDELMAKYNGNTYLPNLFEFFIKLALSLLNKRSTLVFIIPDRLGFNSYFSYLRREIVSNFYLKDIVYKWDFETVIADTMTLVIKKESINDYKIGIKTRPSNERLLIEKQDILKDELAEFRGYENRSIQKLVNSIQSISLPLQSLAKSTSGFGGDSKKIFDSRIKSTQIEVVKGKGISRYGKVSPNFFEFKDENLSGRTRDKNKLGKKEKVLLRKTGNSIIATYDCTGVYPEQSLYFLFDFQASPKTILGILNSSLMTWYYLNRLVTNEDSTPQLKNYDLDNIPITKNISNCKLLDNLVNQVLELKQKDVDTSKIEHK